ncbi:NUDIX domain-containing protein [Rhodobacteraceae bacterium CCMM004]|nr:NUDIX domain-containing protein [Rhodobacteraceae bacterium CCMM004]
MKLNRLRPRPLRLTPQQTREVRTQFAALCWRMRKDRPEFLLITGRRSRRWGLPRGWPMPGHAPAEAAAVEAFEEAGVSGETGDVCLGIYTAPPARACGDVPRVVAVFPLRVTDEHEEWPERGQRRRRWVRRKKAAALLRAPELARLILDFDPARL